MGSSESSGKNSAALHKGLLVGGKYQLEEWLGEGGMGEVWKAVHIETMGKVAIKFILPKHAQNQELMARFTREGRLAASIDSDHICKVNDTGRTDEGRPFLIMEMLRGQDFERTLDTWRQENRRVNIDRVVNIINQVLDALDTIHSHPEEVVHRDLKPSNIFLTKVGPHADFVKILDFGIAKVREKKIENDIKQRVNSTVVPYHTPGYCAPEQLFPADVDPRTDIYAVGVIFYEAVTGQHPSANTSVGEPLVDPCNINHTVPKQLGKVILRSMELDKHARYSSAKDMQNAINRAMREEADNVVDASSANATTALDGNSGMAGDVDHLEGGQRLNPDASRTFPGKKKRGRLPIVMGGALLLALFFGGDALYLIPANPTQANTECTSFENMTQGQSTSGCASQPPPIENPDEIKSKRLLPVPYVFQKRGEENSDSEHSQEKHGHVSSPAVSIPSGDPVIQPQKFIEYPKGPIQMKTNINQLKKELNAIQIYRDFRELKLAENITEDCSSKSKSLIYGKEGCDDFRDKEYLSLSESKASDCKKLCRNEPVYCCMVTNEMYKRILSSSDPEESFDQFLESLLLIGQIEKL